MEEDKIPKWLYVCLAIAAILSGVSALITTIFTIISG